MSTTVIRSADLQELIAQALMACNTSEANAGSVARAVTQAEIDGQKGHGLSRVPSYVAQVKARKVDGQAVPEVSGMRPATLLIDVKHGFAFPALDLATERLPSLARAAGIAAAAFTRSHHVGVAGLVVERLAEQGFLGLAMGNTPLAMASWGGKRPVFGTNPIAFAAPQRGKPPVVVDLALSQVARGKILTAAQKGEAIPPDWAFDGDGRPTTNANAALAGTLAPLGGAKGSALAFLVEVMAVALSGANFAFEASSFLDDRGGPPGVGQLLIAIDPAAFAGSDAFLDRCTVLAAAIESDPGARLPGSRRLALREKAAREGVAVATTLLQEVRRLAGTRA
jgi:(2R)-3-sulfolactate dehydrogenase (NADP+)